MGHWRCNKKIVTLSQYAICDSSDPDPEKVYALFFLKTLITLIALLRKNTERQQYIVEFCYLVNRFFPKDIFVINLHTEYNVLLEGLPREEQWLTELLLKHLVKLYAPHRAHYNGSKVEAAREDILTALSIVGEVIRPQGFLTRIQRNHYIQLQLYFTNGMFTAREAEKALCLQKTQTYRMLTLLKRKGLLTITKGYKNRGFIYQILEYA